jgi:hypothetical protein
MWRRGYGDVGDIQEREQTSIEVYILRETCRDELTQKSNPCTGPGVGLSINRRMIESWYVYRALVKYVGGDIEVDDKP